MLARLRAHLTYANVVSTLCLFILLGGGAYAATKIDSGDVKDNSLKSVDLKDGKGVEGIDVVDRNLSTSDYALDQGTANLDFASIPAQTCAESGLLALDEGTFDNDPIVVTADDDFSGTPESKLTYETRLVGGAQNAFRLILCNITGAAYDPPGITFQWAILNRP